MTGRHAALQEQFNVLHHHPRLAFVPYRVRAVLLGPARVVVQPEPARVHVDHHRDRVLVMREVVLVQVAPHADRRRLQQPAVGRRRGPLTYITVHAVLRREQDAPPLVTAGPLVLHQPLEQRPPE